VFGPGEHRLNEVSGLVLQAAYASPDVDGGGSPLTLILAAAYQETDAKTGLGFD
jgi:hypothetical protein